MKIKKGFVLRKIDDDYLIVALGKASMKFSGFVSLNEVGAFLWKKLESENSLNNLCSDLVNEYEIDGNTAKKDVENFLKSMKEANVLE